ncbi:hypothetical protein, partial [Streptomyces xanthophaeus]|uniref:hypothetical protein n=1 Tax=Streptomyces xanthophaeus TaxID=67385 RepID=UPI00364E5352
RGTQVQPLSPEAVTVTVTVRDMKAPKAVCSIRDRSAARMRTGHSSSPYVSIRLRMGLDRVK